MRLAVLCPVQRTIIIQQGERELATNNSIYTPLSFEAATRYVHITDNSRPELECDILDIDYGICEHICLNTLAIRLQNYIYCLQTLFDACRVVRSSIDAPLPIMRSLGVSGIMGFDTVSLSLEAIISMNRQRGITRFKYRHVVILWKLYMYLPCDHTS